MTAHNLLRLDTAEPLDTMRAIERQEGILEWPCSEAACTWWWTTWRPPWRAFAAGLAAQGIAIRRLEQIQPSLEDVFVALIEAEERKAA